MTLKKPNRKQSKKRKWKPKPTAEERRAKRDVDMDMFAKNNWGA